MALKIQQLNADTTFLLTLSPPFAPERPAKRFPGDYKILIDPWLSGHSSILHPTFQISHHTSEPAITNLANIKNDIDLIIISQDKPDHCHKETLCSLPKQTKINILATSAAAKKIRSWKHFDPQRVHVIKAYSPADGSSIMRITLPAYSSASAAGEITIANIPTKHDVTRLHNAIGITYQPPSTIFTLNTQSNRYEEGATVKLSGNAIFRPSTAMQGPRTASSSDQLPSLEPSTTSMTNRDKARFRSQRSLPNLRDRAYSGIARSTISPFNHEKVLSIIYTPHGVSPHVLESYIRTHLTPFNALPVTALLHSINVEENPKLMGGQIAAGAPGGVEVAKAVGARYWIGAHDEAKDNRGLATVWIKSRRYDVEEVKSMLRGAGLGQMDVHRLGVGEVLRIPERVQKAEQTTMEKQCANDANDVLATPGPTMNGPKHAAAMQTASNDLTFALPNAYKRPIS